MLFPLQPITRTKTQPNIDLNKQLTKPNPVVLRFYTLLQLLDGAQFSEKSYPS